MDNFSTLSSAHGYLLCPICGTLCYRHGVYPRSGIDSDGEMHRLSVMRFRCPNKRCLVATISLLPSFLIPHKQYMAYVAEELFLLILYRGMSVERAWRSKLNACQRTIRIWLGQFRRQVVNLRQDGFIRSGIPPPAGISPEEHFAALVDHHWRKYGEDDTIGALPRFQADLCESYPFMGVFRPLLSGSQS